MAKIYFHGNILTMNKNISHITAVHIDNGIIQHIGRDEDILKFKSNDTECIDLNGKTMMPGFIDGHSHFAGLAMSLSQCDLSSATSFQDIKDKMQEFINNHHISKGEWVIGTNYDHNFLVEKKHPDKYFLDSISSEHLIMIIHISSHMGVVNSKGLLTQNLNRDTKDPVGGHFGRSKDCELNGYMEENAFVSFRNQMPMPSIDTLMDLFVQAQDIYASYGITTVQEGMVTKPLFNLLQYAASQNLFKLDVVGYIDLENEENLLIQNKQYLNQYINHLKIGGYKIFLDGSPQGRTAWLKEPYENEESYSGYPIMDDEHLYQLIFKSLMHHQQLLAHCNGNAAAEQYITQFEKVIHDYPELDTRRSVMIHAQLVEKNQLKRMAKLHISPSFFVAHTYYWGDIHIQNFGYKRAKLISPAASAFDLNLPVTFHQDSPVLPPDVFQTIWCAMHRITKNGIQLDQKECIHIDEGLQAITINGAYQYYEENQKGTIEVGKKADLVILEQNPLIISDIQSIQILETIKDGKTIYKKGL